MARLGGLSPHCPECVVLQVNGTTPIEVRALLRRHGIRLRRRLGQNFLEDQSTLERIAAEARIGTNDSVLEIGCGFGSLTRLLAQVARNVVAVELDPDLASIAREVVGAAANVRILCADILTLSQPELGVPEGYIVAANIPYYVTSPILRHLLESGPKPRRIVLTVQAEVAERICAEPPRMSVLALSVQVYGKPQIVTRIPATAFFPAPKVESAVVRIECYDTPRIASHLLPNFFTLIRACFSHRRKMLRNTLSLGLSIPLAHATGFLTASNIDPRRRAETLTIEEWAALSKIVALPPS